MDRFDSGNWESDEAHCNVDSTNAKQLTLISHEEEDICLTAN